MDRELFDAASRARAHAYAPYSRFPVGAALRTGTGAVHAGANVENASFPEGWCAETSALAHMIAAALPGPARSLAAVLVIAEPIAGRLVTPCGGCRQRLAEFGRADTLIHCFDPAGDTGRSYRLGELLPAAFALGEAP